MEWGPSDETVVDLTMRMWTNFAKTGNASTTDFTWPEYTISNETFLEIGPDQDATLETGLADAIR